MNSTLLKVVALLLSMLAGTLSLPQNISNMDDGNFFKQDPLFTTLRPNSSDIKKRNSINYSRTICTSADGSIGICYKALDCSDLGGQIFSPCADKESVCCVVENSCTDVTTDVVSYFVNPNYPNPSTEHSSCEFRIDITNRDVCQVRVDFEQMSLAGPHTRTGGCRQDRFIAMSSPPNFILLSEVCGENSGQHMYVHVDGTMYNPYVSLVVMTSSGEPCHWRIRSTMIDCKLQREFVAPVGCLQFHEGLSGSIKSFNYRDGHGHYQSQLNYAICFKYFTNTCNIEFWQAENSVFWINSMEGADLPEGTGLAGTRSCDLYTHDYLYIPEGHGPADSEDDPSMTCDVYCGRSLSGLAVHEYAKWLMGGNRLDPPSIVSIASTVKSYSPGPFIVRFHTDRKVRPEQEVGFHIMYEQMSTGCKTAYD